MEKADGSSTGAMALGTRAGSSSESERVRSIVTQPGGDLRGGGKGPASGTVEEEKERLDEVLGSLFCLSSCPRLN